VLATNRDLKSRGGVRNTRKELMKNSSKKRKDEGEGGGGGFFFKKRVKTGKIKKNYNFFFE